MSRECCGPEEGQERQPLAVQVRRPESELSLQVTGTDSHGHADDDCCNHDAAASEHDDDGLVPVWRDRALLFPALAGVFLLIGYGLDWSGFTVAGTIVHGAALLAGAWTFVPGAIRRVLRGRLGVGLLMTIAAIGAVLLGKVAEAAALAFLFSIAEALEDRAMDRARQGLRALLDLIPNTARVSRLSGEVEIPAQEIRALDLLVVRPGERVATDGIVTAGRSSLDTSAVTGESIPVEVGPGDSVPAGSVNGQGALQIEASADGHDNSLTTIVRLVEDAQSRKGERARLADRIARPLVPVVLIVAALVVVFGFIVGDPATWTERALVVLVAASPCALAIAVPVTVISAIGSASKFGVIIKSGAAFEQLGAVTAVAFDKTGTLTRNAPEVVDVVTAPGHDRQDILTAAAALERHSTHPLAAAISNAVDQPPAAFDVTEEPGRGLTGEVHGRRVRVGSTRWLQAGTLQADIDRLERNGETVVVVEIDGVITGVVGVRDELRDEAAETITALHEAGIRTLMLTGDNQRTATTLAARAGIHDVRAEQLPQDKASAVNELRRNGTVAMIGDGVNDAPALASADVGIAMGATGAAAAVESADVAFTGTDLRAIPAALLHARRGRRIMTSNIGLSLAIIVVLFPLALAGALGLAGVVLVHELAEVVVIANGVRAARRPRA
ncbi:MULTISPECIES: cation-translocating P-type ATPase [Curtobacterium]|jgi:cation-transporting ATPase G|uniref:heavy metal translocating P-type ATPase n=1 Tax=Curtobacterium TaxID=2034 RepID=UPI000F4F9E26|nr:MULTISPECIES: cation-translocating P-type ATPase [Curtobacterium]MBT1633960.1 cadmium-translocating P-type ATPase [Curtobacterium flaccumfaciens pv. oortii]MCU0153732.1 cation-translocating P-type ATPase [Curtobacterium flaccumfaciens pv. poinsettiae]MCX2846664.1 cation-translocating P-type ATPase [Curtobacterium flaccumfaciens pv. oortii]RPE83225.1 cation-transporting ATPase G [Curtobacterium sp. PhB137]TCL79041.1 cation-transporting ATPase G [Curtobacterium sp. PhB128]